MAKGNIFVDRKVMAVCISLLIALVGFICLPGYRATDGDDLNVLFRRRCQHGDEIRGDAY